MNKVYYPINVEIGRMAHNMHSFKKFNEEEFVEGYQKQVDNAYELVTKVPESFKEKGYILADRFAKKYAEWQDKYSRMRMMSPSAMIAGPAGISQSKQQKQQAREKTIWEEYNKIEHILKQIENLENYKPRTEKQGTTNDKWNSENNFFEVIQNEELNRLQLKFEGKPSDKVRELLKGKAFKWSPKNGVWQRQLTQNAIYATKNIIEILEKES